MDPDEDTGLFQWDLQDIEAGSGLHQEPVQ